MQLSEDDIEEVDALYMQNLRGIAELSGGEITTDNFHEVQVYLDFLGLALNHYDDQFCNFSCNISSYFEAKV